MIFEQVESVNRAGHLAALLGSCKALGVTQRPLLNEILRAVLEANAGLLGVWSVWEPNALDHADGKFVGRPGHDQSGRFIPLWHRLHGRAKLEANTEYDKPTSAWYFAAARTGAEVVVDPYEYRVGGRKLVITSQSAPIYHAGQRVGVAGFDIDLDALLPDAPRRATEFEPVEAVLGRGHVLLDDAGSVRYCSPATRQLIAHYVGHASQSALPETLRDLVHRKGAGLRRTAQEWVFPRGRRSLFVRLKRHPQAGYSFLLVEERHEGGQPSEVDELSPREREVAEWMGQGKTNEEIALILGISSHTVKNHLDKVFRKLGVENRHAAAAALRAHAPEFATPTV